MRYCSVLLCACLLIGCEKPTPTVIAGEAMGTRYHITLGDDTSSVDAIDHDVRVLLESIEAEASQWRQSSWVSRFNQSRSVEAQAVPAHVWAMLLVADRVHRQSGGALDITIGPVVELWGFGASPRNQSRTPTQHEIDEALSCCGMDKLALDRQARSVRKTDPRLTIDLSSVAKGYAVDRIAELLDGRGMENYVIAFGGEVRAKGQGPTGDGWTIGVDHGSTRRVKPADAITLRDQAVATSGGGQQQHVLPDGSSVTHLIDPRSGMPVTDGSLSVTVLADSAVLADAWATALSVTHAPDRKALAERGGVRWLEAERR